jgi:hypothetical protein
MKMEARSWKLRRCWSTVACFLAVVSAASGQPTEVSLQRLSVYTDAELEVNVLAVGETAESDTDYTTNSGGEQLVVPSIPPLGVNVEAFNPHAFAEANAYTIAQAGYGSLKITSGWCWLDFYVEASPGAFAGAGALFSTFGQAEWKIPDSQTGNTWIEAQIQIIGVGGWGTPPDANIHVHVARNGRVKVAGSELNFISYDDGTVLVWGTWT